MDSELGRTKLQIPRQSSKPVAVCAQIAKEVRSLLRKHNQTEDQLLGLVVGVPAIVNVKEGIVFSLSKLKDWSNVPLK